MRNPNEIISAGEYASFVEEVMSEIKKRGKEPILCGGAGLYLEALTKGIFHDSTSDLKKGNVSVGITTITLLNF